MAGRHMLWKAPHVPQRKLREYADVTRDENRKCAQQAAAAINARPDPGYAIRPMTIDDAPFITDSWASSYAHYARLESVPSDVYKIEQRARIDRLVKRSIILCLCPKRHEGHVTGWVCFEPPQSNAGSPILHYILIHPSQQMSGLATQLLQLVRSVAASATDPIWATHWTFPMRKIGPKWNLIYNPYLLEILNAK